jgi:hypothetical protein
VSLFKLGFSALPWISFAVSVLVNENWEMPVDRVAPMKHSPDDSPQKHNQLQLAFVHSEGQNADDEIRQRSK